MMLAAILIVQTFDLHPSSFRTTVQFWLAVFRDLGLLLLPILILGGVVGLLLAVTLKFRSRETDERLV